MTPATSKAAAPAKETPMERLKRLRAAQLNKTFQNEVLTQAQRKATEERDRAARLQIERAARQYSPPRRSPSPPPRLQALLVLQCCCFIPAGLAST